MTGESESVTEANAIRTHGNRIRKIYQFGAVLIAVAMLSSALTFMAIGDGPTEWGTYIEPGSMVSDADYIIFKDGSDYKAKNGTTGAIDESSGVFETLWGSVMAKMAGGGDIYLDSGLYMKTSTAGLGIYSNVHVEMGANTIIRLSANVGNDPRIFWVESEENITISGGELDGNKNAHTTITGIASMAIGFSGVNNVVIDSVRIKDVGTSEALSGYGVYLANSSYAIVTNNHISGCKRESVVAFDNSDNCIISGNVMIDAEDRHIVVHDSNYTLVSNNILTNSVGYAIDLYAVTPHAHEGIICNGNSIQGSGSTGIYTYGVDGIHISANSVYNVVGTGIALDSADYARVTGNLVDNAATGVHATGDYCVVSGNTLVDCDDTNGAGIMVDGDYAHIASNTIIDARRGIQLFAGSDDAVLASNVVKDCEKDGIYITAIADAVIIGNTVSNNGVSAIGGEMNGIAIATGAVNVKVTGNLAFKGTAQNYALRAFAGASDIVVTYNDFEEGGTLGAINDASTDAIIQYNTGHATEASSIATITGAVNTVVVTHGLVATPTIVLVTGNDTGIGDYWVTATSSTQFTISFESQPGGSTWGFYWYAQTW